MANAIVDDSSKETPHLVLVFPPVWLPMVPHLAIPTLTAYLRELGIRVTPLETNVAFFTEHLFTPETLTPFISKAKEIMTSSNKSALPLHWRELLEKELPKWEVSIEKTDQILKVFRQKELFLNPDQLLAAQDQVLGFLYLSSIAHWPGQISFNHYLRDDLRTLSDLLDLCEDPERNIFLPFFMEKTLPEIERLSPTAVGISISTVHQFVAAMTFARLIRVRLPKIHIVVGGKHLLNIEKNLLKDPFLYRHFFDSAILLEGERPLERLLPVLHSGASLNDVPNIMFLDGKRVISRDLTEPVPLQELPRPDFSDTPWEKYLVPVRYAPIRMAEGCYWGKCTFCGRYGPEGALFVPPDRVLDDLEHLMNQYGVRDVTVNDDCLPPSYWEEITDGIVQRRLKLSMLVWAKPVAEFTGKIIQKMARAGVKQIRWGVESAQPRVLKLMRKGTTVGSALRVLQDAHKAGIWNHACIIIGFPTETREDAQVTLDFIESHSDIIQSFILYPFHLLDNSYIFEHPDAFAIRDLQIEPTPLLDQISFRTDQGLTDQEARSLIPTAKRNLLDKTYHWPFWFFLKTREYLQLYIDHYGLQSVLDMPFKRDGLRIFPL
ncbi:B12-binding domain-containing radical SAM protein [Thermodesulfobacteriota bacterium]